MAEAFGALEFPAPDRDREVAFGDPAITVIANFFAAILNSFGGEAYQAETGQELVRTVRWHNPEGAAGIHEHDLPCLYVWREHDDPPAQIADEVTECRSTIGVAWIRQPVSQHDHSAIESYGNVVSKTLRRAVKRRRFQGYIAPDDPDPSSAELGSDILNAAGLSNLTLQRVEITAAARIAGNEGAEIYPCVRAHLESTELLESTPADRGYLPYRIDVQITTGGEDPLDTPQHIRDPYLP